MSRGVNMHWDQYFRHNLRYGHTFWNLRPKTLDFFKISNFNIYEFYNYCMHASDTVPLRQITGLLANRMKCALEARTCFRPLSMLSKWCSKACLTVSRRRGRREPRMGVSVNVQTRSHYYFDFFQM